MRIGIDARFYGEAGPGRYAKNIVEHLEDIDSDNEYCVFLRPKGYREYKPKNQNFKKILADYKWYSWSEQVGFLILLLKMHLNLFYVPHFNIPVLYPGKLVTAIPDIIMHSYSTERGTTLFKPYFLFKKFMYKFVVWWAVIRSFKVIVPSKDVLSDFLKTFKLVDEDKYVLAYEGFDPTFGKANIDPDRVLKKYGIVKPFLLYISSMYEHKNVPRLIDSFRMVMEKYGFSGQLVLVGKMDRFSRDIQEKISKESLTKKVIMPGMLNYITDDETVALRKNALAYVFPSLKEGFSLTPLEAQYFKLPCVVSDIPCHKEIYGNSVLYFDPMSTEKMAEKINEVITNEDLRNRLREEGIKNIKNYSWISAARITLRVFQEALKNQ